MNTDLIAIKIACAFAVRWKAVPVDFVCADSMVNISTITYVTDDRKLVIEIDGVDDKMTGHCFVAGVLKVTRHIAHEDDFGPLGDFIDVNIK